MSDQKDQGAELATIPKYARYRNVRRTKSPPIPDSQTTALRQPNADCLARTKSTSRYRRPRTTSKEVKAVPKSGSPPVPQIPGSYSLRDGAQNIAGYRNLHELQPHPRNGDERKLERTAKELRDRELRAKREWRESIQQMRIAEKEKADAEAAKAKEAEDERIGQIRSMERLNLDNDPPQKIASAKEKNVKSSMSSEEHTEGSFLKDPEGGAGVRPSTSKVKPSPVIEQGGRGIVPQTDAPISAVNAGERRVLVRCKQSSISLPITPTTTPADIIHSAAHIMTQNISTSTAILSESYSTLGLERRLRHYEHIRDVMNSWDRDTQNALFITNSDSPRFDTDLMATSVPSDPPIDVTLYMYHSQRPGKWNKRYITLMSSGQIFISKTSGSKLSDKDVSSICHLSDFDIYMPTAQQIRKNLKPPKKHCYAIKSQQKTTMFLSTENFVHFFSTDNDTLASDFYRAVQRWRSWYLVHRMGEGFKTTVNNMTSSSAAIKGVSPYTLASFQPMMDAKELKHCDDQEHRDEDQPRQIPFQLRNSVILSGKSNNCHNASQEASRPPVDQPEEFAPSGLLGRTYTMRQNMLQTTSTKSKPFTNGHDLLRMPDSHLKKDCTLSSSSNMNMCSRPATSAGITLQRGKSTKTMREQPKPLLDFTPTFKEPPQWDMAGKGRGVKADEGTLLVDKANTPSQGLDDIPKPTVFRRTDTVHGRPMTSAGRPTTGVRGEVKVHAMHGR